MLLLKWLPVFGKERGNLLYFSTYGNVLEFRPRSAVSVNHQYYEHIHADEKHDLFSNPREALSHKHSR